jgi:adenosylmethionine-8-amino-7-oxononanoate aminotransferase
MTAAPADAPRAAAPHDLAAADRVSPPREVGRAGVATVLTAERPDWLDGGMPHIWLPYAQMKNAGDPLPVVATHGSRIVLADGRELIDGIASWWTACHGYNHPHIAAAARRQLDRMPHVMFGGLAHEPALTLARRLAALMPAGLTRVFFSDSGSVAVEVAMKMAVQYWLNNGVPERTRFLAFNGAYHGDTTGAMAVSDPVDGMHSAFGTLLPRHLFADLPRDDAQIAQLTGLMERHAGEIAGIIVEPLVQGAGGMRFHDAAVLRRLRSLADRYETLLIFDEIFTGFGRTGTMFACQDVAPDIITLSKALTGGTMGLAATIANDKVFAAFWSNLPSHALMHGPTFMANPLACAAANASLDLFEREPRLAQAAAIAQALRQGLAPCRNMRRVRDVRVLGAIGVVELDHIDDIQALRRRFVAAGVFVRPFGNIIYLTPALTIAPEDLAALTDAIVEVVATLI